MTAELGWLDMTSADSSGAYEASVDYFRSIFEDLGLTRQRVSSALAFDNSATDASAVPVAFSPRELASNPGGITRLQLFSVYLFPGQDALQADFTIDTLKSDAASELRTAMASLGDQYLTGTSYSVSPPAPTVPVETPTAADLSSVPFIGLAGIAPYPHGKLSKYGYDTQEDPQVVTPVRAEGWGEIAARLLPSPIAQVIYNLPLSLAYVTSIALSVDPSGSNVNRHIRTQIYLDPTSATASWQAISDAIVNPEPSPAKVGEKRVASTQSGDRDPRTFRPFDSAGIFFQRGPFGVIVEIRDQSNKKPSLKDVASYASTIDKGIQAVITDPSKSGAALGIPSFDVDAGGFANNYQQIRIANGVLVPLRYEIGDQSTLDTVTKVYQVARDAKSTMVLSYQEVPEVVVAQLFAAAAGVQSSTKAHLTSTSELYLIPESGDALGFAGAFAKRLSAKYPDGVITSLPSTGTGADAVETDSYFGTGAALVVQRTSGNRVAVIEFDVSMSGGDANTTAALISANAGFIARSISLADQILKGAGYLFTILS